jgi:S-adenosylmethionine decarboxylase
MDGCEWIVDAHGCDPAALSRQDTLEGLFARLIADLSLRPIAPARWHRFPPPGGLTGLCLLGESHLACHTFPEHGTLCLNVFCCQPRPEWDFSGELQRLVGATRVQVRRIERRIAAPAPARRA